MMPQILFLLYYYIMIVCSFIPFRTVDDINSPILSILELFDHSCCADQLFDGILNSELGILKEKQKDFAVAHIRKSKARYKHD